MKNLAAILFLVGWVFSAAAEDSIEFLNGTQLQGKVLQILKAEREVEFEASVGGKVETRRFPYAAIHAVTWNGKSYVVTPKTAATTAASGKEVQRVRQEVMDLIEKMGNTPPEWFKSARLSYPDTLDLTWPEPAPPPWNNQKNVGQYIWDVINPNPDRWGDGIKLMHHLLETGSKDAKFQQRIMEALGGMYFRFFADYARAAFWWQRAGVEEGEAPYIWLGECYWRLGNRQMAEKQLNSRLQRGECIKLWGDMGEADKAVELAGYYIQGGGEPREAHLLAGNALRQSGRYDEALKHFQAVLDETKPARNAEVKKRYEDRAKDSIEAISVFERFDLSQIKDGTYQGESLGYSGPLKVSVEVKRGKIDGLKVTDHEEKQFYSALTDVPATIIRKQSVRGVEATSHATITSEAIINAAAKALSGK